MVDHSRADENISISHRFMNIHVDRRRESELLDLDDGVKPERSGLQTRQNAVRSRAYKEAAPAS